MSEKEIRFDVDTAEKSMPCAILFMHDYILLYATAKSLQLTGFNEMQLQITCC